MTPAMLLQGCVSGGCEQAAVDVAPSGAGPEPREQRSEFILIPCMHEEDPASGGFGGVCALASPEPAGLAEGCAELLALVDPLGDGGGIADVGEDVKGLGLGEMLGEEVGEDTHLAGRGRAGPPARGRRCTWR